MDRVKPPRCSRNPKNNDRNVKCNWCQKVAFIDFEKNRMMNCEEKFTHCCNTKKQFIDEILNRQKQIAESFLKHKETIHEKEDPTFLNDISDLFDLRNWNLSAFREEEIFQKELDEMMKKLEKIKEFYQDLHERDVQVEFRKVLKIIYANEKENQCLSEAMNESHVIDQWTFMKNNVTLLHENDQKLVFRLLKRAASAPNAQTGCERANSEYNHFKNSLSNRMKLPMIKSRL